MGHVHHGDHGHGQAHSHGAPGGDRNVAVAAVINVALGLAQIAGGLASGSIALVADAIHNLSDAATLVIAFGARRIARRPADTTMTFGYGRAEVVAALVNYTSLVMISLWLGAEAALRLMNPSAVAGGVVIALAGLGLVVNLGTALLTWRLARTSLNIRAAFLHNLSDAGASVAVLAGGVAIKMFGWHLADPLVTLGLSVWILWHAASDMRPVIRILMLGAPADMEFAAIQARITADGDVDGVHHMHLWQIDERRTSLEAHLVLRDGADAGAATERVRRLLADEFGITHATFQAENATAPCAAPGCG